MPSIDTAPLRISMIRMPASLDRGTSPTPSCRLSTSYRSRSCVAKIADRVLPRMDDRAKREQSRISAVMAARVFH